VILFGIAKARPNEIQIPLLSLDTDCRFLLEAVEDVYVFPDLGCVNAPERIAIEVRDDLNSIDASHWLRGWMGLTELCLAQRGTNLIPDFFGKSP
jgi:hypothetical protein